MGTRIAIELPAIPNARAFRADFRRRLDALPLGGADADAVVAEATRAFRFDRAFADERFEESRSART